MSKTYSASHYAHIDRVEREHFWFVGRNERIQSLVTGYIPDASAKTFLDIGCGTGVMLKFLSSLGFITTGLDVNARALTYARTHTKSDLVRLSVFQYKPKKLFDVAGAFDVMEHIQDDVGFIGKCRDVIVDRGYLFLTVPAGMSLWSSVDVVSGHKRRYSKQSMRELLKNSGFQIRYIGYWNSLLLPFYSFWRLLVGKHSEDIVQRYLVMPPPFINAVLLFILRLERIFGYRLPFGATLVVVAQKI
jgi:SAM-dependent methyltransferase